MTYQWQNDNGQWHDYKTEFKANCQQLYFSEKYTYIIDTINMIQTNADTQKIRPIRLKPQYESVYPLNYEPWDEFENYWKSSSESKEETCAICLGELKDDCGYLKNCNDHFFHQTCIKDWWKTKKMCPICKKIYGHLIGDMPDGEMRIIHQSESLAGYPEYGSWKIEFYFPGDYNDNGTWRKSEYRTAYLPDNNKGQLVLKLFKQGFQHRLLFTVGDSLTRQVSNVLIFNGIHMKTSVNGTFGYPDSLYLDRVLSELKNKGLE